MMYKGEQRADAWRIAPFRQQEKMAKQTKQDHSRKWEEKPVVFRKLR